MAYIESPESKLEHAQRMGTLVDPETPRPYALAGDQVLIDEVESIGI